MAVALCLGSEASGTAVFFGAGCEEMILFKPCSHRELLDVLFFLICSTLSGRPKGYTGNDATSRTGKET